MPGLILTTAPAVEPLSLAEAKAHLRVDHTADDALITTLITVAREAAEEHTSRAFISQGWRLWLNGLVEQANEWWDGVRELPVTLFTARAITLPRAPLISVATLSVFDANDVETIISTTQYTVDTARLPGQLVLEDGVSLPINTRLVNAIKVDFTAGYGANPTDVPATLRHGMLHHMAALYENRGDTSSGIPSAVLHLYQPYRILKVV